MKRSVVLGLAAVICFACTKGEQKSAPAGTATLPPAPPAAAAPTAPTAAAASAPAKPEGGPWMTKAAQGADIFATFKTTEGNITVKLFSKDAPKTVGNFVGLAAGEKPWTDPKTSQKTSQPLYNGTVFHRVIPGFMIQGGDPLGNGTGDPGYTFEDEFQSGRGFDKPGLLAMANRGPNTNGSQIFITDSTPQHLKNHHTIFGEVVTGYDIVEKIAHVPTGPMNRPVTPVTVSEVTLSDKAP
jgi:peptidyl-prolyl cis-trans isomerase A (cyclophilin A)